MGWTKLTSWISIIVIMVIFSVTLMNVGTDLKAKLDLTDKSNDYIDSYSDFVTESNMELMTDDTSELKSDGLLSEDNVTGEFGTSDQLANTYYSLSKFGKVIKFLFLVYNFPSFIIESVFPVGVLGGFTNVINVVVYGLIMSLVIVIFLKLK